MRKPKFDSEFTTRRKQKQLLRHASNSEDMGIGFTKYGEPILLNRERTDGDLLRVSMFYSDGSKAYPTYMNGIFANDSLVIQDIGVLDSEGYAPKGKPPFGRGYGTVLMAVAFDECHNRGISKIYGQRKYVTQEQNERQVNYYRRLGFELDSQGRFSLELPAQYELTARDGEFIEP